MFRQMFRLAIEAAKVEIDRWANPAREPEPIKESVPVVVDHPLKSVTTPVVSSKWSSGEFQTKALKSPTCPDCDQPKKIGAYRCPPCHAEAVKAVPWNMVQEVAPVPKRRRRKVAAS